MAARASNTLGPARAVAARVDCIEACPTTEPCPLSGGAHLAAAAVVVAAIVLISAPALVALAALLDGAQVGHAFGWVQRIPHAVSFAIGVRAPAAMLVVAALARPSREP